MELSNTRNNLLPPPDPSSIAILMCTYNGEKFITQQMESFFEQTHPKWELWVSDDASHDTTLEQIRSFEGRGKAIHIVSGPKVGYAANFLSLIRNDKIRADYFAWSDQDDVWLPDKLERAVRWLSLHQTIPALYSSRTELIDADNTTLSSSPRFSRPAGFRNALCQNIGGGNTMVFNMLARDILLKGDLPDVVAHDWWAYMAITGAGGVFLLDEKPGVRYRQHSGNQMGENRTFRARLSRLFRIVSGEYHTWNARNITALSARKDTLTKENAVVFENFSAAAREEKALSRLKRLIKSGIYRQSQIDDFILRAMAVMKKYP